MLQEFVNSFRGISIGDEVEIKEECLPPYKGIPAPNSMVEYANRYGNCFRIIAIQETELDNAIFSFYEVNSVLDYYQIRFHTKSRRIVNFGRQT